MSIDNIQCNPVSISEYDTLKCGKFQGGEYLLSQDAINQYSDFDLRSGVASLHHPLITWNELLLLSDMQKRGNPTWFHLLLSYTTSY